MSKRTYGDGGVYKEGNYWIAQLSFRDPATGERRRSRRKLRTRAEAVAAIADMRKRQENALPMRDSNATLANWTTQWETTTLAASTRRATTQETYRTLLKTCVRAHIGGVRLADITATTIEGWLVTLEASGLSSSTRRQALTVLRAALDAAVRDGLLSSNPAVQVRRPVVRREEAHHYSNKEVAALLEHTAGHRLRPLLIVLLGTGLRRGEALALRWENIDLDRDELRVRGTLVRTAKGLEVNEPKTRNGWRTVPLSAPVKAALLEQQHQQRLDRFAAGPSWIPTGHVFTTEAGTPLDPRNTGRWFTQAAKVCGIEGSLHTLRHTALTSMAVAGVPLAVLSRVAGHESITTTIDMYGHVSERSARDAVSAAAGQLGLA